MDGFVLFLACVAIGCAAWALVATAMLLQLRANRCEWVRDGDAKYRHFTTVNGEPIGTQVMAFNGEPPGVFFARRDAAKVCDLVSEPWLRAVLQDAGPEVLR